jgi:hypothetical protein
LLEEIEGEEAEKLKNKCPAKVFDVEDLGNGICLMYLSCLP